MALYVIDKRDKVAQRVAHRYEVVDANRFIFVEAQDGAAAFKKIFEKGVRINCKLPLILKRWVDRNPEKVREVDHGDGYNTPSGQAYDVLLERGWCAYGDAGLHTIIEATATETLAQLREVAACRCENCKTGEGW